MDNISIHNIKKVKFCKIEELKSEKRVFYVRELIITNDKGHKTSLSIFADDKSSLKNSK